MILQYLLFHNIKLLLTGNHSGSDGRIINKERFGFSAMEAEFLSFLGFPCLHSDFLSKMVLTSGVSDILMSLFAYKMPQEKLSVY